jgi:hypothetical protein
MFKLFRLCSGASTLNQVMPVSLSSSTRYIHRNEHDINSEYEEIAPRIIRHKDADNVPFESQQEMTSIYLFSQDISIYDDNDIDESRFLLENLSSSYIFNYEDSCQLPVTSCLIKMMNAVAMKDTLSVGSISSTVAATNQLVLLLINRNSGDFYPFVISEEYSFFNSTHKVLAIIVSLFYIL